MNNALRYQPWKGLWARGGLALAVLAALAALATALVLSGCTRVNPPTNPAPPPEPEVPKGPPFYEDVTATSGLKWTFHNGQESGHLAILESLGGGVGLIDYDKDGRLDVVVTGGGHFDKTRKQWQAERKSPTDRPPRVLGYPCKLYRNVSTKGKILFEEVPDGLKLNGDWFYSHGCAVTDYDRDGYQDLLITGWHRMALFHNEPDPKHPGQRHLVDRTREMKLPTGLWTTSAAWADFDGDGYPDLYVCQYGNWSFESNHPEDCTYTPGLNDVCPPKQFSGLPHKVFRNRGGKGFVDVSDEAGIVKQDPKDAAAGKQWDASKGLGAVAVDVNADGLPDVYVACDTVDNLLYINRSTPGHIRFEEVGMRTGAARNESGNQNGSMGLAVGDPFGEGRPAIWVTNYEQELHCLYRNHCEPPKPQAVATLAGLCAPPGGLNPVTVSAALRARWDRWDYLRFVDSTMGTGIAAIGNKFVAWGTCFTDVDHHGWEDLVIANGHAIFFPTSPGVTRRQHPVFLRNNAGHFTDWTVRGGPYFQQDHLSRGVGAGDLDNDGKLDLVISQINEPGSVLRNVADTGTHHWLGVKLEREDYADLVGTRIILEAGGRKQTRFAIGGGSYASAGDPRHIFGLGDTATVERVTVVWPDQSIEVWKSPKVDQYHTLVKGSTAKKK